MGMTVNYSQQTDRANFSHVTQKLGQNFKHLA